jgi:hypothetical protein
MCLSTYRSFQALALSPVMKQLSSGSSFRMQPVVPYRASAQASLHLELPEVSWVQGDAWPSHINGKAGERKLIQRPTHEQV